MKLKMYDNPVLEFFSKSGPIMMVVFHLIISSILLYTGYMVNEVSIVVAILVFIAGFLFWTLTEYLMHRYLFHYEGNTKWMKAFHYAMHGYHHEVPHDTNRLFMPPLPAFLFLSFFLFVFYLIMGNLSFYFLPGFEIGYLSYALIHYSLHIRVPKNKYFYRLWLHHSQHHYQHPEKGFGVSSVFWDRIFGTNV